MNEIKCGHCKKMITLKPLRPPTWTGEIRRGILCPYCDSVNMVRGLFQGEAILQEPKIEVITFDNGAVIHVEAYECTPEEAQRVVTAFRRVLEALPKEASALLQELWQKREGCPHVWLLKDRKEWNGQGWAAGTPTSLYMVSTLIADLPQNYLDGFIAHEFGHMLFIAAGETTHIADSKKPEDRDRCEWLVWQLMKAWGYDQVGMEEWMECNYIDDKEGIRKREKPLEVNQIAEGRNAQYRTVINQRFSNETLPAEYLRFTTAER